MFLNASYLRWTWFTKDVISDTISFCPNQIKLLSPTIKEYKGFSYLFIYEEIPFGFSPENLDLNNVVHLNTMAVTIFDNELMENAEWLLDTKTTSDIPKTSYYIIDDKIGYWYDYIGKKIIWNYSKFWTCKMWVVWIVLKLLLNLVAKKSHQQETQSRIQLKII